MSNDCSCEERIKMTEILPRHYIIGILMFTFIIVGGVSMFGEFRSVYPSFGTDDEYDQFNRSFNKLTEVTIQINKLESNINSTDPEPGLFGFLNSLISSAWNTIKLLFSSFDFMDEAFEGLYTMFGVPKWVGNIIMSLITVIISFAIYTAIFQREI